MVASKINRADLLSSFNSLSKLFLMVPLDWHKRVPTYCSGLAWCAEMLLELLLTLIPLHIFLLYLCTFYLHYNDAGFEYLVNCLMQAVVYVWAFVVRIYFRHIKPKALADLVNLVNKQCRRQSAPGLTYVSLTKSVIIANKGFEIYMGVSTISCCTWLIFPLISGDRTLPLDMWYPFDAKEPIVYEVLYFLQALGQLILPASFIAASGLFLMLAILMCGQFDVLFCSLKNLTATAYITAGIPLKKLQYLQKRQDPEVNEYNIEIEHFVIEPDQMALNSVNTANSEDTITYALHEAFRDCVLHHRYILKVLQLMEDFFHPLWFFKIGETTTEICLMAFGFVMSSSTSSRFLNAFMQWQYLMLGLAELTILGYSGESLTINCHRCGDALLRSPWYMHSQELRQEINFFLLNSLRQIRFTAGKFFILNIEGARKIFTMAFSLLTLLQSFETRK